MAKAMTMNELFLDEIRDLYDAEKQLTRALPKMAKACSSEELRSAFEAHLVETEGHVERLEEIFELLGEKGTGKKCVAMAGMIKEGEEMVSEIDEGPVRDAGLIAAAQKVEHYEISGYGTARTHAQILGHADAVSMLDETLGEEKNADLKLTDIAENIINAEATAAMNGTSQTRRAAPPKTRGAGQ